MRTIALRSSLWTFVLTLLLSPYLRAVETTTHPFPGTTIIARDEAAPRPVRMHVLLIDLQTPGLRFVLTPHSGPLDTTKQTTLQFITDQHAQLAINAHFFEPWPAPDPDPGTADLVGFAASNGVVYSPFDANPPKPYAINANAPAINIDANNRAAIVHRNPADPSGRTVTEAVTPHTALAGNEQILTGGDITAGTGKWDNTPNPITVIGLAPNNTLVILVVDGRQPKVSEGLSVREAAELLHRDYAVTDAINLDGGGSSALCIADPAPRVVNTPVGLHNSPNTLRVVGSNLGIFALPSVEGAPAPVLASWILWLVAAVAIVLLGLLLIRRRMRKRRLQGAL